MVTDQCPKTSMMTMAAAATAATVACQMFSDSSSGDDDVFLSPASELGTLKLDRQLSSDMPMTDEDPTRVRTCSLLNIVATISFHAFTAHPVGH